MSYSSERVLHWRKTTKDKLIQACGGCCNRCGYSKVPGLDFHHVDPATKKHGISKLLVAPKRIELILDEVSKCILLCKCCHAELHAGLWNIGEITQKSFDVTIFDDVERQQKTKIKVCDTCGAIKQKVLNRYQCPKCPPKRYKRVRSKAIRLGLPRVKRPRVIKVHPCVDCSADVKNADRQFCLVCAAKRRRKVERPSPEELQNLLFTKPIQQIAASYGVSDKAVAKWAKQMFLTVPGRGYWQKLKAGKITPGSPNW